MTQLPWPDPLQPAASDHVAALLERFWRTLEQLVDLLQRQEQLLAARMTAELRQIVTELMLALNGIAWPHESAHLNSYLSADQRAALEKTLLAPAISTNSWIGQAVALVVIYRWYAPQLVQKFGLAYPAEAEAQALLQLQRLAGWPRSIMTD
ncbi:MAG: hypothetical protein ACKO4U_05905 [Caldilinea sp.]|jgi:hypothetical protein